MLFGLTIRPLLSSQTVINGYRPHGISARDLTFGLLIKSLLAGIDLIELAALKSGALRSDNYELKLLGAPMNRRSLFFAIAAAVIIGSVGTLDARAGIFVPLPNTLDQFVGTNFGNFTTVAGTNETDTFSNFTYSVSPVGTPPTAANVTLNPYSVGPETGIAISGAFFANPGQTVDYAISYLVTAPAGHFLTDAVLSMAINVPAGGGGLVSIGETLTNGSTGIPIASLSTSATDSSSVLFDSTTFTGVTSIFVSKDIIIHGGTSGAGVSIINQGFSSTGGVPEPSSLALLGIGMTGFLAFRRFFKKTSIA
jgi:hypothetical protein